MDMMRHGSMKCFCEIFQNLSQRMSKWHLTPRGGYYVAPDSARWLWCAATPGMLPLDSSNLSRRMLAWHCLFHKNVVHSVKNLFTPWKYCSVCMSSVHSVKTMFTPGKRSLVHEKCCLICKQLFEAIFATFLHNFLPLSEVVTSTPSVIVDCMAKNFPSSPQLNELLCYNIDGRDFSQQR